jgi:hypothetical protein
LLAANCSAVGGITNVHARRIGYSSRTQSVILGLSSKRSPGWMPVGACPPSQGTTWRRPIGRRSRHRLGRRVSDRPPITVHLFARQPTGARFRRRQTICAPLPRCVRRCPAGAAVGFGQRFGLVKVLAAVRWVREQVTRHVVGQEVSRWSGPGRPRCGEHHPDLVMLDFRSK